MNAILQRMREDDLRHDPWGTSLQWHFAVCDLMIEWAPPYPPSEWGFRQAMGGADTENPAYQEITAMIEAGEVDADDLLYVGKVLHRYENMLTQAGRSY